MAGAAELAPERIRAKAQKTFGAGKPVGRGTGSKRRGGPAVETVRELSLAKDDDRKRLNRAIRAKSDPSLVVVDVRKNARKFRLLIKRVIVLASERGVDDVAALLERSGRREYPDAGHAEPQQGERGHSIARADPSTGDLERERTWTKLRQEFFSKFNTVTPRELAELTGSRARNVAARGYEWAKAGRIFGVHDGRETKYPLFQIREGQPIPQVAEILKALRSRDFSDWEVAIWFATPNANIGDWELPGDALARDPDVVARAAAAEAQEVVY